ncbi:leucine-rich repeat-containing protein 14-like [Dromiciops gliroides]|uniref:leucine-rich repeat-containing protein 14-like n=1 Tax=Dromiciops gliroides TaxID=33562 RepID=UPI001CC4A774|nr:leucine-rich repeat-containing protein 14-like [Dromiciops gliroides]
MEGEGQSPVLAQGFTAYDILSKNGYLTDDHVRKTDAVVALSGIEKISSLTPAMYSLTFLSARQLVQDEEATCKILEFVPRIVYKILFNAAFKENKTNLLYELVKTWPYSQLEFQKLIQTCGCYSWTSRKCPECQQPLTHQSNKNKIEAIVLGVVSYLRKVIMDGSQQPLHRFWGEKANSDQVEVKRACMSSMGSISEKARFIREEPAANRRLQKLDMTGSSDGSLFWNQNLIKLWGRVVQQFRVYNFSQQETWDPQSQAREQVGETSPVTTFPEEARVDFLVDLEVSSTPEEFVKNTLQGNANNPLRLLCRDFYSDYSFLNESTEFLVLLDPLALRRIDLSNDKITMTDIRLLMSHIVTFQNLKSLKLSSFKEDEEWWKAPRLKDNFDFFVAMLNKLRHLGEIALHGLCLSDHLEYLLGSLQCPLESLRLLTCSLKEKDLSYLARSSYSAHLVKLDLAENNIAEHLDAFLELLKSVSNSLMWLNVAMCGIKDTDFYETMPYLYYCTRLSHLGLHGNPLSSTSTFIFLEECQHKLPNLKVISVPIFLDCCKNVSQHGPFPMVMLYHIDYMKCSSVVEKMKQLKVTKSITYIFNRNIDAGDYFDLVG